MTGSTESHKTTPQLLGEFMQRLGNQDADGIGELFAADIDWYVPGSDALPWTGARSRREQVAGYFHTMWLAFSPGKSTATLDKIVIDGDDAVVFSRFSHMVAKNGKRLQTPAALHLTVANGQFVRMHLYEDSGRSRSVSGLSHLGRVAGWTLARSRSVLFLSARSGQPPMQAAIRVAKLQHNGRPRPPVAPLGA